VITKTTPFTFTLDLDSSSFGDYKRQGTVENVKVAKPFPMHSWEKSFANPSASTEFGMLNPPDLSKFGRSEQLHAALFGIEQFVINKDKYPGDNDADRAEALALTKARLESLKATGGHEVELEEDVFNMAVSYAGCSISPTSAFFGGIVA